MSTPLISIFLGSYNRLDFLKAAINSIRENGITVPYEVIVIDGGSTDGSVEWLVVQKDIITIVQHNRGEWQGRPIERRSWGYFMNIACRATHGKYLLMMSDDSLLVPGATMNGYTTFEKLLAEGQKIGAVAFYWRHAPDLEQYCVMKFFGKHYVNHGMYLRSALEEAGWIDEVNYMFYCADADVCLKMDQAGYRTVSCSNAIVEHYALYEAVRQENIDNANTNNDMGHFKERWCRVHGIPEDTATDEFVSYDYLVFQDPYHTALKFPQVRVAPSQSSKKWSIRRILNKIRSIVPKSM